jgi:hypothetical protein
VELDFLIWERVSDWGDTAQQGSRIKRYLKAMESKVMMLFPFLTKLSLSTPRKVDPSLAQPIL